MFLQKRYIFLDIDSNKYYISLLLFMIYGIPVF